MTKRRSNVSRNASKLWQGFIAMALVAAVVFSTPTTAGATSASAGSLEALEAADIDISYTAASDRSGPALLDGAAISGSISTFVTPLEPDGDIQRVEFSLDGTSSGTEFAAPYDWPPRARGAWDSSSVTDGTHTLSIDVHLDDGSVISKTATFTVSNGVTPVDSGLAYSGDIGRGDNLDLNGAVVEGTVWAYVFPIRPASQLGIQNVSFTLDGSDFRTEFLAPYDFGPAAIGWDTTTVADGEHTIVAAANGSGGTIFISTATFTVANDGPPPTDPDGEDPDGEDPDGEGPTLGLLETLAADGRFTTLVELIGEATFDPPPPDLEFTIFAPTDDAFAALPAGVLDEIRANPDALNDALLYHIVEGNFSSEVLATIPELFSVTGVPIGVELVGETVVLNGNVNVTEADILATDGVVHAVDAVLTPPQRDFLTFLVSDFARGSTEVPGPGDPDSLSQAFIDVFDVEGDDHELCINASTTVPDPTGAHIHAGAAGVEGGVVVNFGLDASSWEQDEFVPISRFTQTCVPVESGLAEAMIASPGDYYFNVHSATFPGGANREQLFDGEGTNEFPRAFTAAPLIGSNEVPGPGDPDSGRSFIDFSLPVTDNNELCFRSVLFNVDEVSAAHIHAGAAGVAGDVVVNLEVGSRWPVIADPSELLDFVGGCSPIDPDVQTQIEADPGAFYANFHNAAFPAGAVRAQIVAGVGEIILIAPLEPEGGGSPEVNGFADFAIFPSQGQLCWGSDATGVGQPTGFSILGPDGFTIALDIATYPFQANASPFADLTSFGCQTVDQAVLEAMVANPDAYSVSIDTADGAGALTGPLFDPFTGPGGPPPDGEDPDGEDPDGEDLINLQILAINDFHGNIATTSSAFGGVGRADFLAANVAAAEADADNSILVSAGDLIGASPLISALFHDEPTIEAMNMIGLEINGVGNHEFDEGPAELQRMANGGSHPVDGDLDGDGFEGAEFEFLAANVVDDATGETVFEPYTIKNYEGVDVAFIGMTLEGTPTIVTPSGVAGLTFNDEVETVNALVPGLQEQGIEAIVVLLHEGGIASEGGGDGDGCGTLSGNLYDIVVGLDDAIDVVIGGHNNQRFACIDVEGKAVTMAYHSGRMFTDIDVTLDPETGDMTVVSIDNKENFQEGVTPDADVTALIDRYDALAAPLSNRVIGSIIADLIEDVTTDAGESSLGDVIADAQLAATSSAETGNAVVAFMNPGGIRANFVFDEIAGGEAPGEVTFGEAFSVQPFGNSLVTMTLTGEQIHTLLTQQFVGQERPRVLQVSDGFTYSWDPAAADEAKIDASTIMIDGVLVDPAANYRVTVNSFLADGGDNFAVLVDGTDRLGGEVDLDALVTYFGANSPVAPGPENRIGLIQ